jgi:hypothetical protein
MKKTVFITLLFILFNVCFSQTANIRIKYLDSKNMKSKTFDSLVFIINGVELNSTDSETKSFNLQKNGFDSFSYYYKGEKNKVISEFKCKFKPNNSYKILPCICCGEFMLVADSLPQRGSVRFVNKTNRKLIGIRSEFNLDTINKKSATKYFPSDISMNCGFREFYIEIAEFGYANPKFDYNERNTDLENEKLNSEQEQLWITKTPFLFLHGEKITATYDDKERKIDIKLD